MREFLRKLISKIKRKETKKPGETVTFFACGEGRSIWYSYETKAKMIKRIRDRNPKIVLSGKDPRKEKLHIATFLAEAYRGIVITKQLPFNEENLLVFLRHLDNTEGS